MIGLFLFILIRHAGGKREQARPSLYIVDLGFYMPSIACPCLSSVSPTFGLCIVIVVADLAATIITGSQGCQVHVNEKKQTPSHRYSCLWSVLVIHPTLVVNFLVLVAGIDAGVVDPIVVDADLVFPLLLQTLLAPNPPPLPPLILKQNKFSDPQANKGIFC